MLGNGVRVITLDGDRLDELSSGLGLDIVENLTNECHV